MRFILGNFHHTRKTFPTVRRRGIDVINAIRQYDGYTRRTECFILTVQSKIIICYVGSGKLKYRKLKTIFNDSTVPVRIRAETVSVFERPGRSVLNIHIIPGPIRITEPSVSICC